MRGLAPALAVMLLIAACGDRPASGTGGPLPPTASPPAGSSAGALSAAQLKYRLVDRFGRLWYCDPDFYPVARADQDSLAESRFADVVRDGPTFQAITAHLGIGPAVAYTHEQKVAIYTDWKMLNALQLEAAGAAYRFTGRFTQDERTGVLVDGRIDGAGAISVDSQTASGRPPCPICLARGTRIATPRGPVAVEDLREGMLVWTMGVDGRRVAAPIALLGHTTAPRNHTVVHLVLSDGREVSASPGHPLSDRRSIGTIVPGDIVDGALVRSADRVPYGSGTTFDLLPAGPTGVYWADGVPLGSTLRP